MAKYVDIEPIIKKLNQQMLSPETTFINTVLIGLLEQEPVADVVEVVRCKDCKFAEPYMTWFCNGLSQRWKNETSI